jgi:hypothetical protein
MTARKYRSTLNYLLTSAFCALMLHTTLGWAQEPANNQSAQSGSVRHEFLHSGQVDPGPLANQTVKTPGGTTNYIPM